MSRLIYLRDEIDFLSTARYEPSRMHLFHPAPRDVILVKDKKDAVFWHPFVLLIVK